MKIGYARVSTTDQKGQLQLDALKTAGCEKVYFDKFTGTTTNRTELKHCKDVLRSGDTLYIWRLDRLARSLRDLIDLVLHLERDGIALVSLQEKIDTTSSGGKLIFHIFGAIAEFERNLIRERTKAGLEAARARGRKGGRPRKLSEQQVKLAKAMLEKPEITATEVAEQLNVSRSTLYRSLARKSLNTNHA